MIKQLNMYKFTDKNSPTCVQGAGNSGPPSLAKCNVIPLELHGRKLAENRSCPSNFTIVPAFLPESSERVQNDEGL